MCPQHVIKIYLTVNRGEACEWRLHCLFDFCSISLVYNRGNISRNKRSEWLFSSLTCPTLTDSTVFKMHLFVRRRKLEKEKEAQSMEGDNFENFLSHRYEIFNRYCEIQSTSRSQSAVFNHYEKIFQFSPWKQKYLRNINFIALFENVKIGN